MKKRSLYIVGMLVVVMALVFSFASIATAKYAGAFYNGGDADLPGYLSWPGANQVWETYGGGTGEQTGAHGDYITTTTKCAVCHASHRAYAAEETNVSAGVDPVNMSLTTGGTCVNCHTVWGAGGADKKIEWAQNDPGPHGRQECTSNCHTSGIHGGSNSMYNGMNAYMLGSDKDAAITDAFERGNVNDDIAYNGTGTTGANWFQNGTTGTPADMSPPAGVNARQMSAAKAMATGYTCSQSTATSGCHTSGQFATNVWGFATNRAGEPTQPLDMNMPFTGHLTTFPPYDVGLEVPSCGPCHPGALSGGYRTIDSDDEAAIAANQDSRAYGCDQCHDMVGKATNTTAWPHGNRNIAVWEWDTSGNIIDPGPTLQAAKNLWMYQSNLIVGAGLSPSVTTPVMTRMPQDGSFKVINNAVTSDGNVGNINDGTCLKCHMATDRSSIEGMGIDPAGGATIATPHQHALFVGADGGLKRGDDGSAFTPVPGHDYTGTDYQIFLWK